MFRPRRRHRCGPQICSVAAAVLLLLSVSLLYSRLNFFQSHSKSHSISQHDAAALSIDPLLDDPADPLDRSAGSEDLIDELDDAGGSNAGADEFSLGDSEEELDEENEIVRTPLSDKISSLYFFDHANGVVRRGLSKKTIEEWEDYAGFESILGSELGFSTEWPKSLFGSDDIPVEEKTRTKLAEIRSVEDALLLKGSKLREGWGEWFDKKGDFLRRDRMFKSNLEALNPLHNPILQDPDGPGVTWLTKGDKLMQKELLNEFKKVPFPGKKTLGIEESIEKGLGNVESKLKKTGRKILDGKGNRNHVDNLDSNRRNTGNAANVLLKVDKDEGKDGENTWKSGQKKLQGELLSPLLPDGRRWGYYPGLDSRLSFPNFMDAFFRKGRCSIRVFMVWNSPPWMFGVRHQRGLESILFHHRDACVVIFSETLELNFFSSFVTDGFKVAVAMPNLDALLKGTPTHVFASVWHQWKKTEFYHIHYSELIRLAALYKYGGVYLDFDIILLKPLLSTLSSAIGLEDELNGSLLNGAVMAFRKHSTFIMECLNEFYASYDDTLLRWNGPELLSRVARNFSSDNNLVDKKLELSLRPSFVFFPISQRDIPRYFTAPVTEGERGDQNALLDKILRDSITVHLWHSETSALIPEPESLVSRLINRHCVRRSDVL